MRPAEPISEGRRFAVALVVGLAVASVVAWISPWQITVLAGWDSAGIVVLVWIWKSIAGLDAKDCRRVARIEDSSRGATRLVLTLASVASLIGVLVAFMHARGLNGAVRVVLTTMGVGTVVVSWMVVHTLFALRYADLYYGGVQGGIDFGQPLVDEADGPTYMDFAYLAFTIGMTFQVSDTTISSRNIRRTVFRHALLSFVFGTIIVALTINLTASLIR